jgi:membrane dipeptidase
MDLTPIFDGHNDTLLSLLDPKDGQSRSFLEWSARGHLDLPRARAGGLVGGLFAIFVPPPPDSPQHDAFARTVFTPQGYTVPPVDAIDPDYARLVTGQAIEQLHRLLAQAPDQLGLVRAAQDMETYIAAGKFAIVLHMEGAEAVQADCANLEALYQQGLRSVGLVWSRPNAFGYGINYQFPGSPDTGPGLTPDGLALVRACNEMGILVDLAHLNEKGFWDAARTSRAPLVVTHTGMHAICPTSRNLTDAQVDAVGKSGGVIGIMFEPSEIRPDGRPEPNTPLSALVDHVDHVVQRIGIDHVALGSDFDGAMMPAELKDAAGLPKLVQALQERGYEGQDLAKITSQNWLRVLKQTLKG